MLRLVRREAILGPLGLELELVAFGPPEPGFGLLGIRGGQGLAWLRIERCGVDPVEQLTARKQTRNTKAGIKAVGTYKRF
jgi:hypothetical protein